MEAHAHYRGAVMGRPQLVDRTAAAPTDPVKFTLCRIRVNRGGYDSVGTYWGLGKPLYRAAASREDTGALIADYHFRAADREAAKANVRSEYPNAGFFR